MQDINPIQGPIRPQDEQSKKSKTPAGAPDKFKEIYRVQAVDSTDEEKKKKRKRPEEEVEDLPPPTTQPLQTSSSNLEASPYAVQPPSKKAAAIQGPKEEIASETVSLLASDED